MNQMVMASMALLIALFQWGPKSWSWLTRGHQTAFSTLMVLVKAKTRRRVLLAPCVAPRARTLVGHRKPNEITAKTVWRKATVTMNERKGVVCWTMTGLRRPNNARDRWGMEFCVGGVLWGGNRQAVNRALKGCCSQSRGRSEIKETYLQGPWKQGRAGPWAPLGKRIEERLRHKGRRWACTSGG